MPLSKVTMRGAVAWEMSASNTGSTPTKYKDAKAHAPSLSVSTYQHLFVARYSIAASGTQTVDLSSFTNRVAEAVTTNKIIGLFIKATGNTGKIKLEPHGTNGLTWFFTGTTPGIELECGTGGCGMMLLDGIAETIDGTHKQLLLTNTGLVTITVDFYAVVGTA